MKAIRLRVSISEHRTLVLKLPQGVDQGSAEVIVLLSDGETDGDESQDTGSEVLNRPDLLHLAGLLDGKAPQVSIERMAEASAADDA